MTGGENVTQELGNYVICRHCGQLTKNITRYCDVCMEERKKKAESHWADYQKKIADLRENKPRVYQTIFWKKLRKQILNRDGWMCVECKRRGKISPASEVDHIIPVFLGGKHCPDNLQSLCHLCHVKKTQQDSMSARGVCQNKADSENQKTGLGVGGV